MAALTLKNHVHVTVEDCLFRDNEIAFPIRGGTSELGGARGTIDPPGPLRTAALRKAA